MSARHIAFDLGAESGRAVVGMIENSILTIEELHRFPTQGMKINGTLRWNVFRFYEEILTALKRYAVRYGNNPVSIGVDTWGLDFGLLDKNGDLIELPYHYRDDRSAGTDEIMDEVLGKERVYEITGIQFLGCNTLNQLIGAVKKGSKAVSEAERLLFMADLLHNLLCGSTCSEFSVASISQMMDARTMQWSEEIFSAFGLPDALKTPIVFPGACIGNLYESVAAETGLSSVVKIVTPAVHDTASAAAAVPAQGENWAYISSGTWCIAGLETGQPLLTEECCRMSISNSGGAFSKNLFLKNVMGLWIIQQCKKAWNRTEPELDYAGIMLRAAGAKPFAAFIDPDDALFFNPADCLEAIGQYLKKTGQCGVNTSDVGVVARIVFEGLALKYRYVLDNLKRIAGKKIDVLHIIGGGTKNTLLNQFSANALGVPVVTGPIEATAMGNLLLQAYGCGEIRSLEELRSIVRASSQLFEYQPQETVLWENAYERYRKICGL